MSERGETDRAVKLLLVDDHVLVRAGMKSLLATVERFAVIGEAGTVAEAIAEARRCQPDVVLMDVRLPDGSGAEACREIRSDRTSTRIIMLTSYSDEEAIVASLLAGASGYLLKEIEPERLFEAIDTVARGRSMLDPAITDTLLNWLTRVGSRSDFSPLAGLTDQERRILPLIAAGKTNREIGNDLYLSEHTVKTYVSHLLHKLQLRSRAEAAAFGARLQKSET